MYIVLLSAIRRTFNFLRIFSFLSHIVTMLSTVIFQLRIFMTFFFILCLLISLQYCVIGIGNVNVPGQFRTLYYKKGEPSDMSEDAPNKEYRQIGMFLGNLIQVFRLAIGDFAIIGSSTTLGQSDSILFWITWFITIMVAFVIFLNFIVAEASESYNVVSESLAEYTQQQKADLIGEAESIIPQGMKKPKDFPQYIIMRSVEK